MYVHKLNLKKTKFMNKMIMNRLTMLAVTLMASMACFAQGKGGETTGWGSVFGPNYQELSYSVTTNSIHVAEVTGFASYVVATPEIMDDPEAHSTDPNLQIEKNTIIINHFMTGSPNVWIPSVADNAFASVASDLASRIKTIKIDFKGNNTTQYDPVVIGENAFAGLTSVTDVVSYIPGEFLKAIPTNAFAATVYKTATLTIPEGDDVMKSYADETKGWSKFKIITNGTRILGDVDGVNGFGVGDISEIITQIKKGGYNIILDVDGNGEIGVGDISAIITKMKN